MAAANASARGQRHANLCSPLADLPCFVLTARCGGERSYALAACYAPSMTVREVLRHMRCARGCGGRVFFGGKLYPGRRRVTDDAWECRNGLCCCLGQPVPAWLARGDDDRCLGGHGANRRRSRIGNERAAVEQTCQPRWGVAGCGHVTLKPWEATLAYLQCSFGTVPVMRTRARHIWLLVVLSVGCLGMSVASLYRQDRMSPQIRMLAQMVDH